jgi:hypothetical protein
VRQLPLLLSGDRIGRLAERDERFGGKHHEQSNETALRRRALRIRDWR